MFLLFEEPFNLRYLPCIPSSFYFPILVRLNVALCLLLMIFVVNDNTDEILVAYILSRNVIYYTEAGGYTITVQRTHTRTHSHMHVCETSLSSTSTLTLKNYERD
jgi:hypothetical protein